MNYERKSGVLKNALDLVLWALTAISAMGAMMLLWGAGFLRFGGFWPSVDDLEKIGGFLSGLFTPIALMWAARAFLLQKRQYIEAIRDQERRGLREDIQTAPDLRLTVPSFGFGTGGLTLGIMLFNQRETALSVFMKADFVHPTSPWCTSGKFIEICRRLDGGQKVDKSIELAKTSNQIADYEVSIILIAQRLDGLFYHLHLHKPKGLGKWDLQKVSWEPATADGVPGHFL